jgi:hypothetical protein
MLLTQQRGCTASSLVIIPYRTPSYHQQRDTFDDYRRTDPMYNTPMDSIRNFPTQSYSNILWSRHVLDDDFTEGVECYNRWIADRDGWMAQFGPGKKYEMV